VRLGRSLFPAPPRRAPGAFALGLAASLCASWAIPDRALARETGTLAFGREPVQTLAFDGELCLGERPHFLAGAGRYQQWSTWLRHRVGSTLEETLLGTQIGIESEARLGLTPADDREPSARTPVGFAWSLGMPMRVWAFNLPIEGALLLLPSAELGVGGARWWARGARLSLAGTIRVVTGFGPAWHSELEYRFTPFVITRSPGDLRVWHTEHRGQLMVAFGAVGVGVMAALEHDRARRAGARDQVTAQSLHLALEWRPGV
jgi:hypothetical protein